MLLFLAALWIMGSTPGAAWWLLSINGGLLALLAALIVNTAHLWLHGAPREAETETGSIDALEHRAWRSLH